MVEKYIDTSFDKISVCFLNMSLLSEVKSMGDLLELEAIDYLADSESSHKPIVALPILDQYIIW